MVGVSADVAKASRGAAARRVSAPFRLLLAGELERRSEPVLSIFHLHDTHLAHFADSNHLASLPYHRIASVVVGKAEDHSGGFDRFGEVKRGRKRGRDWFVADDVKASFEKGLSRRMVSKIRGDDCDRIDAVGSRFLARHHFLEIAVCPIGGDAYRGGAGSGAGRIGRHCARRRVRSDHQGATAMR